MSLLLGDPRQIPLLRLTESLLKLTHPASSLVQRGTQLVPLLLQANISRGCVKLLAIVRLKIKKSKVSIKLRATILVTHTFGGCSHRER